MMKKEEKKAGYSDATLSLVNYVIRPPRVESYDLSELGFSSKTIGGKLCVRDDIDVPNKKGQKMKCSFFHPADKVTPPAKTAP